MSDLRGGVIRFQCPRCQATFEVPDSQGGYKTNCPKCSQRLQIPRPPPSKTVLAPLLEHRPDPAPRPLTPPVAQVVNDVLLGAAPLPQAIPNAPPDPSRASAARPVTRHTCQEEPIMPTTPRRAPSLSLCLVCLGLLAGAAALLLTAAFRPEKERVEAKKPAAKGVAPAQQEPVRPKDPAKEEQRPDPAAERAAAEALVKAYVTRNADAPVEFLQWGPHLDASEMRRWSAEAGSSLFLAGALSFDPTSKDTIVRVHFRGPARVSLPGYIPWESPDGNFNCLFLVSGKMVSPMGGFPTGDNWKQELRKQLAKRYPALKP